ncbi:MAG: BON domain-containing protein [Steroidobacteraceae bacterium]
MKTILATIALALFLGVTVAGCNVVRGQETAGEYVDDVTITTKVKAELLDSNKVEGLDVNVDVNKGRVTLSGWADTTDERSKAAQLAASVEGVTAVDNQIKIKQ